MKYFVMLAYPSGRPAPVCDTEETLEQATLFDSEEEAEEAMRHHHAAQAWGYTVYEWSWT